MPDRSSNLIVMNDLVVGLRCAGRGQAWALRNRRWLGFGLLPGLIALVIYLAGLLLLALRAGGIAAWATPFADGWDSPWQSLFRTGLALLVFAGGLLLTVLTFTAVTLLIGELFYDSLSEQVERTQGEVPSGPDRPLWRDLWLSVTDSVYVFGRVLMWTVPLFLLGFVPVLGQTVVPVAGVAVAGFFLSVELTAIALERRGLTVRERLGLLRGRKALALGFGVPMVLLFMIPLAAVVLMPGAVAGATLLVRDLAGGAPGEGAGGAAADGGAGGEPAPAGPLPG